MPNELIRENCLKPVHRQVQRHDPRGVCQPTVCAWFTRIPSTYSPVVCGSWPWSQNDCLHIGAIRRPLTVNACSCLLGRAECQHDWSNGRGEL